MCHAGVEHLDLSCCGLQQPPSAALLCAPLLRTLQLQGNAQMVVAPEHVAPLTMLPNLQALVSLASILLQYLGLCEMCQVVVLARNCSRLFAWPCCPPASPGEPSLAADCE